MTTITVVTGTRADFGIYRPILRAIDDEPTLGLRLLACGAHLSATYGNTVDDIEREGFVVEQRLNTLGDGDAPEDIAASMSKGIQVFSESFAKVRPDLLLVVGDRYEMFAAVAAALPFSIPVAHIHGGERSEGAIDEALRHCITKMSHIHLAATDDSAHRIIQMGEQPDSVHVTGAPALDNLCLADEISEASLETFLGVSMNPAPLLVTFHPVSLEYQEAGCQIDELVAALEQFNRPIVFTFPNADTANRIIVKRINEFCEKRPDAVVSVNLGTARYFALMRRAAAMVGNSSSGIIEAPSFQLPVVNIGNRQRGRLRAANVIDCMSDRHAISTAIERALSSEFRERLSNMTNPYGDGNAAARIVGILRTLNVSPALVAKRFFDQWGQSGSSLDPTPAQIIERPFA